MTIEKAIAILSNGVNARNYAEQKEACEIAIREMKKAIPAKSIDSGKWNLKTCPVCNYSLSDIIEKDSIGKIKI